MNKTGKEELTVSSLTVTVKQRCSGEERQRKTTWRWVQKRQNVVHCNLYCFKLIGCEVECDDRRQVLVKKHAVDHHITRAMLSNKLVPITCLCGQYVMGQLLAPAFFNYCHHRVSNKFWYQTIRPSNRSRRCPRLPIKPMIYYVWFTTWDLNHLATKPGSRVVCTRPPYCSVCIHTFLWEKMNKSLLTSIVVSLHFFK